MTNKTSETKYIILIIFFSLISILIFIAKFYNLSFKNSSPEDWNFFTSYGTSIINTILSFINILIFIKLTKSVQRASENKAWVEKTEKLTFDYIESVSNLVSFMAQATLKLRSLTIEQQTAHIIENKYNESIEEFNGKISLDQFRLEIFVESEVFSKCPNKDELLDKAKQITTDINDFLNVYKSNNINKNQELLNKFNKLKNTLKEIIYIGKKFSDEVYNI